MKILVTLDTFLRTTKSKEDAKKNYFHCKLLGRIKWLIILKKY